MLSLKDKFRGTLNKPQIIIVGAGPGGLTLAHYLNKYSQEANITVIDREATVGGCHRVRRVGEPDNKHPHGYFTEHGPRIYTSAYLNFRRLLSEDLKTNFFDAFVPYNFTITEIGGQGLGQLTKREIFNLITEFLKLPFSTASQNETVLEFARRHHFSPNSIDYLDRVCRLTDGAGSERYTMFEFLQVFNQRFFYNIYQPSQATDLQLFRIWKDYLAERGVNFILNTEVKQLLPDATGRQIKELKVITNISRPRSDAISRTDASPRSDAVEKANYSRMSADLVILAIPPEPMYQLLTRSGMTDAFVPVKPEISFGQWAQQSSYFTYIPLTLHYERPIKLPHKWGFPKSDWGVAWIVLSDYLKEYRARTLISVAVSRPHVISKMTGKSANQSTAEEIMVEVYRQMTEYFPGLPKPDKILISPGVHTDGGEWKTLDQAFVLSPSGFLQAKSNLFDNLYNLGTQNGQSPYHFTSMEAAMANAIALTHQLLPESKVNLPILKPVNLTDVLVMIVLLVVIY